MTSPTERVESLAVDRPADCGRRGSVKSISLELQTRSCFDADEADRAVCIVRSGRGSKSGSSSSGGATAGCATSGGGVEGVGDGGGDDRTYVMDDDYDPLPAEVEKTVLCLAALALVLAANVASVATVNDRTAPKRTIVNETYPPLRDIGFDIAEAAGVDDEVSVLLIATEAIVVVTTACVVGALSFHAHGSIVLRRYFFLNAMLFGLRLLSMNVTMLPVSSTRLYHCEAQNASVTLGVTVARFVKLLSAAGLWWQGNEVSYCGNYIYNGHTVALVMNCLMADEYCPMAKVFGAVTRLSAVVGALMVIACEFDYTISVITAYYLTTRLFWIYHSMACNETLRERTATNQISKEWWHPIFRYLEGNVRTVVPCRYDRFF